ncbi:MAG: polymorphic toxin type 23 domain-containing protein [Pseudomonadota bacterium]
MILCLAVSLGAVRAGDFDGGARVGLSYLFSTQGSRVGATLASYVRSDATDTELGLTLSLFKTFAHIETDQPGRERQLVLGVTQGVLGRSQGPDERDWSLAANNTDRRHSVSLYSILYRDTYATSQRVRGIGLNVGDFSVRFENDFDPQRLVGDNGDRFRTSAVEIAYRVAQRRRYVVGINLFTGDPEEGPTLEAGPGVAGKHGDYAMTRDDGTPVTAVDRAIGNAWVGVRGVDLAGASDALAALGLDDTQWRLGWSDEAIRHVAQNRFHDLIANPRIPRREDAPSRPYLTIGANAGQPLYP